MSWVRSKSDERKVVHPRSFLLSLSLLPQLLVKVALVVVVMMLMKVVQVELELELEMEWGRVLGWDAWMVVIVC